MDIANAVGVSDKWGEEMSRLIRYDDAIERLGAHLMANAQIDWGGTASTDIEEWKELADMILNGVPTIDAVSVVRCKDCIHFDGFDCNRFGEPAEYNNPCSDDGNDFCSFGERSRR